MNEKKGKVTSLIRAIICVVVMGVIILDWMGVLETTVAVVISTLLLCGVTVWNGIEAAQNGKKGGAIFNFILGGIMLALCVLSFILR